MKESQQGVEEGGVGGCGNRAGLANLLLIFKQQAKLSISQIYIRLHKFQLCRLLTKSDSL